MGTGGEIAKAANLDLPAGDQGFADLIKHGFDGGVDHAIGKSPSLHVPVDDLVGQNGCERISNTP